MQKLYHSIHARGERVEDVIKEIQAKNETSGEVLTVKTGNSVSVSAYTRDNGNASNELEDGEVEDNSEMEKNCTSKVRRKSNNPQTCS